MTGRSDPHYEFSYVVDTVAHGIADEPVVSSELVPLDVFAHGSAMQVLARYLVDCRGLSFTDAARGLGRSVKSVWASYHQTSELPAIDEQSLSVPLHIFSGGLAPLEALVVHLRAQGWRNVDIAAALQLSPKTTHTAWTRAEVKR